MKEGVACYQDYLRGLLDLTDNLAGTRSCRRRRWCATTATTRTSSSPPTRAPRPSPTTPTRSARSTATGSATPSPPAAASATTTRTMGITARGAWESVKRHFREMGIDTQTHRLHRGRRRRHVGRRVRQRHAAVAAHPAGRRVRPPPRLHRPEPRPRHVVRRARAPVQAAALVVGRLRREADLRRRRRLGALGEIDPDLAAGARRARHRGRAR